MTERRLRFVDELFAEAEVQFEQKELSPALIFEAQLLGMSEKEAVKIQLPDAVTIKALLQGFALSVSSLNTYLRCPLSFYYEHVLKVPTVTSEAAANGTAMHNSLQRLFERMMADPEKNFLPVDKFVQLYEFEMRKLRGYFGRKEYERRLAIGKNNLAKYYHEHINSWRKHVTVKVEFDVRHVEVEGVPIKGVIDKIEYLPKEQVRLVDYKTGSLDNSKVARPSEKNPLGGNYWRQLAFYKILFENHRDTLQTVRSAAISYLEPDTKGRFPEKEMRFSPKDVALVTGMIKTAYTKIKAHEFDWGCGEKHCVWCNFAQENVIVDSLVDVEVEELDD
ncbi:MAG: PD-(D/E)XK nuclease family protein [Bacteroidota bacterium]